MTESDKQSSQHNQDRSLNKNSIADSNAPSSSSENDPANRPSSQQTSPSLLARFARRSRGFKRFGFSLLCISNENDSCYEYNNRMESDNQNIKEELIQLKLRISTGEELKLDLPSRRTVLEAKHMVEQMTKFPVSRQRWCCSGKILPNKSRLYECSIPPDFIIQVIVHTPFEAETDWLPRIKKLQAREDSRNAVKELL